MGLGRSRDPRALAALVDLLRDEGRTDMARSFAAVSIGLVLDPRTLPWSLALSADVNSLAPSTSFGNSSRGTGVLDRL